MSPDRFAELTAVQLRTALSRRELSAQAIAQAALERIAMRDADVHAWKVVDRDGLLARARALDSGAADGLLAGVPVGVKDIIDVSGMPTGCGSPIYEGRLAAADAWCVAHARAAGALFPGKTVTTEFAYFSPGPTTNPHRTTHTPGGSSSGSAAAVAAGMVPLAFGTQTAGSLIRPGSYCGVFAIKPTFGALSLAGIKAFAPSLDTLGWLARSADDLELMRCAMTGEPFDPIAAPDVADLRLGVCRTHEWSAIGPGGALVFDEAERLAAAAGVRVTGQVLPETLAGLVDAQKTIMAHEAARELRAEWDAHRDRLSEPLRQLLETGMATSPQDYARALERAAAARRTLPEVFGGIDALLAPAACDEAPEGLAATGDPVFSRVWTLLGLPCINVPGLRGPGGMPVGVQLVGPPHGERRLTAAAARLHDVLARAGS